MPECPKCGTESKTVASEWVGGAKMSGPMKVQRHDCKACGTGFVVWTDSKTGKVRTMARKS